MKTEHRIFFAIPFDAATRNQYRRIREAIKTEYPTVTTVIGTEEIGPSPTYSDIASFKAQNQELTKQFVHQIRDADIIIADLTHNNPNVHVELGIALTQNKNILRVTGRSLSELGFDIQNLDVRAYKTEDQLTEIITGYLKTFFKIKQLPMSKESGDLYCEERMAPFQLDGQSKGRGLDIHELSCQQALTRDGAIEVEFEILNARSDEDWFGIFFRADAAQLVGSYLAYVRRNGMVEIAEFPGPHVVTKSNDKVSNGKHSILVEFENNEIKIKIDSVQYVKFKQLSRQKAGRVLLAANQVQVNVESAQMICRDTIEWEL